MSDKPGTKTCTSCGKIKGVGQFVKGQSKCKYCHKTKDITTKDSSDDDSLEQRCKALEKRVKKLEKTVEKLSDMLEEQRVDTFGIEKMIQGVALGIKIRDVGNANIVELDE
jgi:uncharacterized coiled-coil protein SlyX